MNNPSSTPAEPTAANAPPVTTAGPAVEIAYIEAHRPDRRDLPDDRPGSPLFWLHHTISESLQAELLMAKASRMKETPLRRAMFGAGYALDREAEKDWRAYCGHYR